MSVGRDSIVGFVIGGLSPAERTVMRNIARIGKTGSGFFTEEKLARRKELEGLDIHLMLRGLQSIGLVEQVHPGKGLWVATRLGKKVEHILEVEFQSEQYPRLKRFERR